MRSLPPVTALFGRGSAIRRSELSEAQGLALLVAAYPDLWTPYCALFLTLRPTATRQQALDELIRALIANAAPSAPEDIVTPLAAEVREAWADLLPLCEEVFHRDPRAETHITLYLMDQERVWRTLLHLLRQLREEVKAVLAPAQPQASACTP